MTHFKNYDDLADHMDRLGLFHMDLTLDRMERFWSNRGLPKFPIFHVVGTNGKGSTSTFLCSIARAHGAKAGLFTSPHFLSPRERVQVNRSPLSRDEWVELGNEVMNTEGGSELTYFEFQTCLAILAFERAKVDIAVMEAGLGGKFDATNVFKPYITLYTPIGMDHEKVLGPTLADIAGDKAGAMRHGGAAITGTQVDEAMVVLREAAQEVGCRFMYAVDIASPVDGAALGLMGIHQTANARLALAGWRWYMADNGQRSDMRSETFGLESAFLPGRMQFVEIDGQTLILDGAHNSHALEALGSALNAEDIRPGAVIFACLEDKDAAPMLPLIKGLTDGPVVIPVMENERAKKAQELCASFGEQARTAESMADALASCKGVDGPVLVCGSLYLLAEFFKLYPTFLTPITRDI